MVYTLLAIFCPKINPTITEFESGCNLFLLINCTTAVNCCIRLSFIAVANCAVPPISVSRDVYVLVVLLDIYNTLNIISVYLYNSLDTELSYISHDLQHYRLPIISRTLLYFMYLWRTYYVVTFVVAQVSDSYLGQS